MSDYMTDFKQNNQDICKGCGAPTKFIKAGVSKTTGKPYQGFIACSQRCGYRPEATPKAQNSPSGASLNESKVIMDGLRVINDNLKVLIGEVRALAKMSLERPKGEETDVKKLEL